MSMDHETRPRRRQALEHIARRVHVHGLVQGVYFRDSCRREALTLGVTGYADNLADGSVEVHIEGPPDAVEALIVWCRRGPDRAHVDRVTVIEVALIQPTGFTIG